MSEVTDAKDFAVRAHGDQRYGSKPYAAHLAAVVAVLHDFGFDGEYEQAGWLHDVAEDTGTSISAIRAMFGDWVANVVGACTGIGVNRRARNASIYENIAKFPEAAVVKVADRIANVEAAVAGGSHAEMYWKEAVAFSDAVAIHAPEAMRKRLNRAYCAARRPNDRAAYLGAPANS